MLEREIKVIPEIKVEKLNTRLRTIKKYKIQDKIIIGKFFYSDLYNQ